jgi:hypothetical protein
MHRPSVNSQMAGGAARADSWNLVLSLDRAYSGSRLIFWEHVATDFLTHLLRAPWKGAISQWETNPPGNFRSGR